MGCTGEDYLQLWDVQGKIISNYGMYRGRLSPIMGCTGEDYLQLWDVQGKIISNYGMYRGRLSFKCRLAR